MEKRLGNRVDLEPEEMWWRVPPTSGPSRRRFAPLARKPQPARLLDLSVSGLRIEAPAAKDLTRGGIVWVQIDDVTGPVRIRRIEPIPGTDTCSYGVELCQEARALTTHLHARLTSMASPRASDWHGDTWGRRGSDH